MFSAEAQVHPYASARLNSFSGVRIREDTLYCDHTGIQPLHLGPHVGRHVRWDFFFGNLDLSWQGAGESEVNQNAQQILGGAHGPPWCAVYSGDRVCRIQRPRTLFARLQDFHFAVPDSGEYPFGRFPLT
jgi:hypothetical protein